jgi:voltage-gated potassium channel Kch
MNVSFAVIDFDPMAIKKMKIRHIPYFFGDATEVDFLCELPIDAAKMVISTLPNADDQITLIEHIRLTNQNTLVIANLSHSKFLEEMYSAGADYIMMPHLLSGQWMGNLLKTNNWDRKIFRDLTKRQREELRLRFTLGDSVEKNK